MPQESFILPPSPGRQAVPVRPRTGKLVAVSGPSLPEGEEHGLDSSTLTVGRDPASGLSLASDDYVSTRHARVEPRSDGVWIEDLGSTNGTFVNGDRLTKPHSSTGDVIRIGQTDLRFEPAQEAER